MDWEVVWTEPAAEDLEQVVRAAARQSQAAAESLRVDLLGHVAVLARFPMIGPVYERDRSGRTREVVCRQYRIFPRVAEADRRVEVLTIWLATRREPRLPGAGG